MCESISVLIIEDNPADAYLEKAALRSILADEYKILWTSDLSSGCEAMRREEFDVVLLDLGLPETTGVNTVRAIRLVNQRSAIVVLSGSNDEQMALQALGLGAEDYVPKSHLTAQMLHRAIGFAIERKRLQDATLDQQAAVSEQLNAVLEITQDALVVFDDSGVVRACSREALEHYGWRPDHVIGRAITKVMRNPAAGEDWLSGLLTQVLGASGGRVGPSTFVIEDDLGKQQLADATVVARPSGKHALLVCHLQPTDVGAR